VKNRPVKTIEVRVQRVERGQVRDLVSTVAAGRVAAAREATLRAEIAGTVLRVHKRRGDRVAAGEVLIEYDGRELRDRVAVARAAVAFSRAQTAQARASAQLARNNADRSAHLRDRGVSPAVEADSLASTAGVADRAADAAQVAVSQALANVRVAEDAVRRTVFRAPFAGIVLSRTIELGEITTPGAPLFSIADTSALHIDAELDEADLGRVREGMSADVSLDAFPGQRFAGTLAEIAPSVTRDQRGNRSIAVRVDLQPDPRLRVGMSADVDIVVARSENVVFVQPNAVMGRAIERAVYVVDSNNIAHRRTIQVGIGTWEAIEVRSGLNAGERVIVTLSSADLADGVTVRARLEDRAPTRVVAP
jgi:HlyD family secretion protein